MELGLGDAREREWFAGEKNASGLHGAGIISRRTLRRPRLLRLETSGRWFDGAFGERRVGGRIAIMAALEIAIACPLLVSVHYESHTGPADRLAQTRLMLDEIDACARTPVLIGGDFNTNTLDRRRTRAADARQGSGPKGPERLIRPMAYEPMFEMLERAAMIGEAAT